MFSINFLLFLIVPILLTLIFLVLTRNILGTVINTVVIALGFVLIAFIMPEYLISNYLWWNLVFSVSITCICIFIDNGIEKSIIFYVITNVLLFLCIIIFAINSNINYKNVYETIEFKDESTLDTSKSPNSNDFAGIKNVSDLKVVVPVETALTKVKSKFSQVPESNYFEINGITAQTVNDDAVYIIDLRHSGFISSIKKDIPGYFTISATDPDSTPKFVKTKMVYNPSSVFSKDVSRKIYKSKKQSFLSIGRINLEVDDDGTPYYIQTMAKRYGLTRLKDYNKYQVATVNAETGDVKFYDVDKAPKFINTSITARAADDINKTFGSYKNGLWNKIFTKRDVIKPTKNGAYGEDDDESSSIRSSASVTPMFGQDGKIYYFTDFKGTSKGQNSAVGYSLIDAKTGDLSYFKIDGMVDSDKAQDVASKQFPEKKWIGTMPVLYQIDGESTWVVPLIDKSGFVKQYTYMSATNSNIVVNGETANKALDKYRVALIKTDESPQSTDKVVGIEKSGIIDRIVVLNNNDNISIQFMIKDDDKVYSSSNFKDSRVPLLNNGDEVKFKYFELEASDTITANNIEIIKFN